MVHRPAQWRDRQFHARHLYLWANTPLSAASNPANAFALPRPNSIAFPHSHGRSAVCSANAPVLNVPRSPANFASALNSKSCASDTPLIARNPNPCALASRATLAASISTIAAP